MPNNKKITQPRLTFLAWGDFQAQSRFARSTIPEEKWGLLLVYQQVESLPFHAFIHLKPEKGTPFERASPYRLS